MQKESTKNKKSIFCKSLLLGFLFIFVGIALYGYNTYHKKVLQKQENVMVEEFFNKNKTNVLKTYSENERKQIKEQYIAIIEIKKISLKTGMVDINSKNNTVEKHVQIIKKSDMPNIENGNLILAAHSGSSDISYFKKIHKLKKEDIVSIYYNGIKYDYKVYDKYRVNKNGELKIKTSSSKTVLTLTTCDVSDDTKQLVVLAEQIKKTKYN